jgi:hypothetical protein
MFYPRVHRLVLEEINAQLSMQHRRIAGTPVQNKQQTPGSDKGFSIARVNQVSADATADGVDIAIGMFYINVIPTTILILVLHIHLFLLDMPTQMSYH